MPRYREISIHDLQAGHGAGACGVIARRPLYDRAVVELPAVSFGCDLAALHARGKEDAAKGWGASRFAPAEVSCWTLAEAAVHGPYGVVTVGEWAVRESFVHVPFGAPGYRRLDGVVDLPEDRIVRGIASGWHAASGGYANYYHWTLDILPKLQLPPFAGDGFTGVLLMPPANTRFQRDAIALLEQAGHEVMSIAAGESVMASQLDFIANMTGAGFAPHPCLSGFFDRVAAACRPQRLAPRRIYVSRAGAVRRRLRNEAEVIAALQPLGYEVCDPADHHLAEQAALFASATHIVAPHGAGLANILFCAPGTQLLELQMDAYMNLCFRKLAALRHLRYGSVVGDAAAGSVGAGARHAVEWSVDLQSVQRAAREMD